MSISTDVFRTGVDLDTTERAQRAVKAFRSMQPTLTAYARILTKNPTIRVEMAARDNGSTDGKKIFYRPPIALGDKIEHQRRFCDKRDYNKQLICLACAVRESVLTTIYHEIAHNCFDSFEETSDEDKSNLVTNAIKEAGGKYATQIAAKIADAPDWAKRSYISMSSLISPFLPVIVNALEDARVNRELFSARRGTKVMFEAKVWSIFNEGVEQKDQNGQTIRKMWNAYPLNQQVTVGLFLKASSYDFAGWFVPEIEEALADAELTRLVGQMATVRSAGAVYHLSFPILEQLRVLGYCKSDTDPEEKESEEPQEEDDTDEESGDESGEESGPQGDPCSDGEPGGDSDDAGTGTDSDGSEGESSDGGGEGGGKGEPDADATDTDHTGTGAGESTEEDSDSGDSDDTDDTDDKKESTSSVPDEDEESDQTGGAGSDSSTVDGTEPESTQQSDESESDGEPESGREGSGDGPTGADNENEGTSSEQGDLNEGAEGSSSGDTESDGTEGADESDGLTSDASDNSLDSDDRGDRDESSSDDVAEGDNSPRRGESDDDDFQDVKGLGGSGLDLADGDNPKEGSSERGDDLETVPASQERDGTPEDQAESSDDTEGYSDEDLIDTGADKGEGGIELIENKENDRLPMGTADDCKGGLLIVGDHEEKPKSAEEGIGEGAIDRAIIQGVYFETPSQHIYGVREHHYGQPQMSGRYNMSKAWDVKNNHWASPLSTGQDGDFSTPEKILGPALLRMRVAFADNQRGKESRGRRFGRVDARVLGKRAPANDDRLFKKKTLPGKKDYYVCIMMDISGSTIGTNLALEKQAVAAQAALLTRMGIPFEIFAYSGNYHDPSFGRAEGLDLDIYFVKEANEPWDKKTKVRLDTIGPDAANLDGHTLEFARKRLDRATATNKIIMYYSDGKMPAENGREELVILQREIKTCAKKGYILMGVGIRTDSPRAHGLDTVQVDSEEDTIKVVRHLEKRLLA